MTSLSSGSGTLAFFGQENGTSDHRLQRSARVAFPPIIEHHRAMKELPQENDTHAPLEVSTHQDRQHALPLLPRRLITDADQASAWALALGDY